MIEILDYEFKPKAGEDNQDIFILVIVVGDNEPFGKFIMDASGYESSPGILDEVAAIVYLEKIEDILVQSIGIETFSKTFREAYTAAIMDLKTIKGLAESNSLDSINKINSAIAAMSGIMLKELKVLKRVLK